MSETLETQAENLNTRLLILLSEYLCCPAEQAETFPLLAMLSMTPTRLAAELATLPGFHQVEVEPKARRVVAMLWALQRDLELRGEVEAAAWQEAFLDLLDLLTGSEAVMPEPVLERSIDG